MRYLLGLVFVVGCVQAGTSPKRWPNHRKVHDEQLEQVEARTALLEHRVQELEAELTAAKTALAKLQQSQAVPAELPKSGGATP